MTCRSLRRRSGVRAPLPPPAARSAGLDSVAPTTRLLAMLDSDDVWSEEHLERALRAHRLGAALYTANWIPVESQQGAMAFFRKLDLADHRTVPELEDAYEFVGDWRSCGPSTRRRSWAAAWASPAADLAPGCPGREGAARRTPAGSPGRG